MTEYKLMQKLIAERGLAILDGAVGTQLQKMGVPMDNTAWAAAALRDYPSTVQRMHELYLRAGADVITTNTYASARHNLEPLGLGSFTTELNLRAVQLAQNAAVRAARGREVWIAGSISGFGITTAGESFRALHRYARPRQAITEEQARANLFEQAAILAEAGVDFLLIEGTGENAHRQWMAEACRATGLPFWIGFRCRIDADSPDVRIGYGSKKTFAAALDEVGARDAAGINVFHTSVETIAPALAVLKTKWRGAIGVYPDADRSDYTATFRDESQQNRVGPDEFVAHAKQWAAAGATLIGGCCGFELPYIEKLDASLPARKPA